VAEEGVIIRLMLTGDEVASAVVVVDLLFKSVDWLTIKIHYLGSRENGCRIASVPLTRVPELNARVALSKAASIGNYFEKSKF
jgi:hypothetical protein